MSTIPRTASSLVGPVIEALAPLCSSCPGIAEDVVSIVARAVEMAVRSGKASDPDVWARAMIAASSEFQVRKKVDAWIGLEPLRK